MLRVELPAGSRPARLREQVDRAYFTFVETLPASLRELGVDQRTFSGQAEEGRFAGPSSLNPVISGAPWLFWNACRRLPDDELRTIAEAGAFLGATYVILDHLIDDQLVEPVVTTLLQQAFFEHALRRLLPLFPASSPFWDHFHRLWAELRDSMAGERQLQCAPGQISLEAFREMARAKAAPVAITLAALAEIGNQPELLVAGEESLKEFGAAAQLAHDVGDWRGDVLSGHHTYFLGQMASPSAFAEGAVAVSEVQDSINDGWRDVEHLRLAEGWLRRAKSGARESDCPNWIDYLDRSGRIIDEELDRCLARHIIALA